MPLDRAAVDHVARLARLALSDQERERMGVELSAILEHAERIQALELDGVEATSHALPVRNVARSDDVRPSLRQDEALAGAPSPEEGRFRVPRLIEEP